MTLDITEQMAALLPSEKPRYLMGVGAPEDVVECVALGIDIFDCAMPTRVARNGALYTPTGRVDIENAVYKEQEGSDRCNLSLLHMPKFFGGLSASSLPK